MKIHQVAFWLPPGADREEEACSSAPESCNRLLRRVNKDAAVLRLPWQHESQSQEVTSLPQIQPDFLIGIFSPGRVDLARRSGMVAGVRQDIERACLQGKPCLACYYESRRRTSYHDEVLQLHSTARQTRKLSLFSYTSISDLQSYLTEYLFGLCYSADLAPGNSRQNELNELLAINDFLLEAAARPVAGVLYTIAGTKAEALSTFRRAEALVKYAGFHGWQINVEDDKSIRRRHRDHIFEPDPGAKWNEILLSKSDGPSKDDLIGYVLFDTSLKVAYLNEALRSRLDKVFDAKPIGSTRWPRAFISYAWESEAHKRWVREFAARLREDGVDIALDQWELAPGDQLPKFMERAIRDNDYVIIICTPEYSTRSDGRQGGVGYEGDIMTAEVLSSQDHRKFIPLIRAGSRDAATPTWLKGKYSIDFRGDPYLEASYQDLLRTLLGLGPCPPLVGTRLTTK